MSIISQLRPQNEKELKLVATGWALFPGQGEGKGETDAVVAGKETRLKKRLRVRETYSPGGEKNAWEGRWRPYSGWRGNDRVDIEVGIRVVEHVGARDEEREDTEGEGASRA